MKRLSSVMLIMFLAGILFFAGNTPVQAAVTEVKAKVSPENFTGQCPKKFEFTAFITANSPGVVEYKWIRSDGANTPVNKLIFKKPGIQKVKTSWQLGGAGKVYEQYWQAVEVISPNKMVSNKAIFNLKCAAEVAQLGNQRIVASGIKPVGIASAQLKQCPDPAAFNIDFRIVQRQTQFQGKVRITGIVKNIGNKDFIAGANQAKAYLYELPPGHMPDTTAQGNVVAQQAITRLNVGATIQLVYERNWNSSSPSEGEFPNSYRLMISLDPDIYMDASKDNDDCSQDNNKKNRSGTEINDLFRH